MDSIFLKEIHDDFIHELDQINLSCGLSDMPVTEGVLVSISEFLTKIYDALVEFFRRIKTTIISRLVASQTKSRLRQIKKLAENHGVTHVYSENIEEQYLVHVRTMNELGRIVDDFWNKYRRGPVNPNTCQIYINQTCKIMDRFVDTTTNPVQQMIPVDKIINDLEIWIARLEHGDDTRILLSIKRYLSDIKRIERYRDTNGDSDMKSYFVMISSKIEERITNVCKKLLQWMKNLFSSPEMSVNRR